MTHNIFRIQHNESIMCGFCCVTFLEYMLEVKNLLDNTSLFSWNDYKKNDKIIDKYFTDKYVKSRVQIKKTGETRNYLLEEINHNDLISENYKKACKYLNHVEHLLILVSPLTGCVSISAFASLVCVPVGVASFAVEIKISAITAGIKKYKSIIKKKKKKHDRTVLLGKHKLNTIEALISKALIDSCISHHEFSSVKNLLRASNETKKEIKNPETSVEYTI